ncbi:hypothetical protein EOE67_07110 [Rheinheimera riviphila]|uniref:Uncharacterized protein n=1 Tax=Rheinheimera riviphila TaxID=1834037 RepID=A0A437R0V2_9GAMM|nr:hypothetical protein [Rheinheimera riviphila]RVU40357.1 hypothetical protein EOE67_07110 [Rheinheimera riviphila]
MLVKTAAFLLCLSAALYLLPQQQNSVIASCTNTVAMTQNGVESFTVKCALAPQTSWASWFSGQSSSAQFHFIDLLELISRLHAKPAA